MTPENTASPQKDQDARGALTSRRVPTMVLSTASNPLTAPITHDASLKSEERAKARFATEGNAVLTGGAGGLGLVAARALFEHGLTSMCLFDLPSTLKSSSAAISALRSEFPDNKIHEVPVDVTSATAVTHAFSQAVSIMGGINILCCLAGIVGTVRSEDATPEQFRKVIDVNLTGSFLCAQAAARHMIASKKGGSIMLTSSISAHHVNYPQPQAAYNVSKIGVSHLTRNLAAEWATHGIRVNSISPGYMDTVLNAGDSLQELRDMWASRCPFGRMGNAEEITGAVVLLCSKRGGGYITGCDMIIDGGAMTL